MNNSLTTFLLINSLLIIGLITIQNESKDNNTQRSTTSSTSPLNFNLDSNFIRNHSFINKIKIK